MICRKPFNFQSGQAALVMLVILVPVTVVIASSINILTFANKKSANDFVRSLQSYYAAEAGIEDSLLRIISADLDHQTSSTITIGGASSDISIDQQASQFTITAAGDANNLERKLSTVLERNTTSVGFFYGVQVGEGGLRMINNAKVIGNIYSNGTIDGDNNAEITEQAWIAGANTLNEVTVGKDAHANTIERSAIGLDAYYQTITASSVGGTEYPGSPDPSPEPLPISDQQIADWQAAAAEGGEVSSVTLDNSDTAVLGPVKINGDLVVEDLAKLTVSGTIWVTGNVSLKNDGVVQLSSLYGPLSGVIVSDGRLTTENNLYICGSEGYNAALKTCNTTNGSHVLLLSTNTSLNESSPAVYMKNNAILRGILYASAGRLVLENNAALKEATAYAMTIKNNATVTYDSGLANAQFSSGPAGGFSIMNWQEIE